LSHHAWTDFLNSLSISESTYIKHLHARHNVNVLIS
jgi:hypothetical protein